jgi:hypothetical protein
MREARTAAATAPAITGAVRVSGGQGDGVQFVFVGATTSRAVAAARARYAPDCSVTQAAGGSAIAGRGGGDDAAPVVNPLLRHSFVPVDGNGDKLQVTQRPCALPHLTSSETALTRLVTHDSCRRFSLRWTMPPPLCSAGGA